MDNVEIEIESMKAELVDSEHKHHETVKNFVAQIEEEPLGLDILDMDERNVDYPLSIKWRWMYPIGLVKCIRLFAAARVMPKEKALTYVFMGAESRFGAEELDFAVLVCEYSLSNGLMRVGEKLYEGATSGDPRAVKMYYEMMRVISDEESEEDTLKKLLLVDIKVAGVGSGPKKN